MHNRDPSAAREYHEITKHSPRSVREGSHFLDWDNQPLPYKVYTGLGPVSLPPAPPLPPVPCMEALTGEGAAPPQGAAPLRGAAISLEVVARLFFLCAGVTKKVERGGGTHYFRAAACTGALYHIEVYLVCGNLSGEGGAGLPAGVYHLAAHDHAARTLREGDCRSSLAEACGAEKCPPAAFVFTSTYWRNAWKYRGRAYRHCFWDSGTMLANLFAAAYAYGVAARLDLGFADAPLNHLLGLDSREEAALGLVVLGEEEEPPPPPMNVPSLSYETAPLSAKKEEYPEIYRIHSASSLADGREASAWRAAGKTPFQRGSAEPRMREETGGFYPLRTDEGDLSKDTVDEVILRRGSARRFARRSIRFGELSAALRAAARPVPSDFLAGGGSLCELFLIALAVEGLPPGVYMFERGRDGLVQLREGTFRREAGFLGLEQELSADAAVSVYFLADMGNVLDRFGNRGYRAAQIEAAIRGGRLYLAAYALGFGATGLTFYDDEAAAFFGPEAAGMDVMFLTLLGRRHRAV